jgi:putative membrane protein
LQLLSGAGRALVRRVLPHFGTRIADGDSYLAVLLSRETSMKKLLVLLLLSVPAVSLAADNPDESFFKDAAEAGMAEVAAGKMAQTQGSSQAVKDFGAMMVKDHSAANAKLKKIAATKGVKLPDGPSLMQKAMNKKTGMKSGDSFDKDYIEGQIKAHKDTVDLLQKSTKARIRRPRPSPQRLCRRSNPIWTKSTRSPAPLASRADHCRYIIWEKKCPAGVRSARLNCAASVLIA